MDLLPADALTAAVVTAAVAAAVSTLGTWRALVVARHARVLAVPDERSSHSRPTPTGGGLGIFAAAALGLLVAADLEPHLRLVPLAVLSTGLWGLRDDTRPLAPRTKLLGLVGTSLVLCLSAWVDGVTLPVAGAVELGLLAIPLTLVWIVGFTNLFNFMDGIDGIAAVTGLVSGAAFAVAGARAHDPLLSVVGAVTSGAALGFLPWNFPRARIFMGDAGSLPLGMLLAFCAVLAHVSGALALPASLLLLGPFLFDSLFTLARRAARGERVWQAHREHLYQRLSRLWGGHPRVTLLYGGMSVATSVLALTYGSLGTAGRLLSLGVPLGAMLAFAGSVLAADRRRESRTAAASGAARTDDPQP